MKPSAQVQTSNGLWADWAPQARPLFRWAGGKRRFIMGYSNRFPEFKGSYHEPFAGSLAVYFWMASNRAEPLRARLSDVNTRLIRCYQEIKLQPGEVWESLADLKGAFISTPVDKRPDFYRRVRNDFNANAPRGDAARFIFLMAAGWNGVYRTNSSGEFNVPYGGEKSVEGRPTSDRVPVIPTQDDILAASVVFQSADLRACSWETSLTAPSPGDFVFLDPPYYSDSGKQAAIYEAGKFFGLSEHERLARALVDLQSRHVDFMLTNSYSKQMHALYSDHGLSVEIVSARRSISSKIETRGNEGELIVTPKRDFQVKDQNNVNFDIDMILKWRERGNDND